jgi:alpha-D-ribose 1-methylphosphonate 5-triphosphate synthase subunit PhnL
MNASTLLKPQPAVVQLLSVHSLCKTFVVHLHGGVRIEPLRAFNLEVKAGEIVALTGPSGAGKSTVLRCIYGNYQADSGSIMVSHHGALVEVTKASSWELADLRRSTIGWVSQFLRVVPRVSTLRIVAEPLLAQGVDQQAALDRASELLAQVGIPERLWGLAPATCSGGEQQRINVARGLIGDHPLLLVDEPTASLDDANRHVVESLLIDAAENGRTVVGVFHDERSISRLQARRLNLEES